jgi:hypothetical protein
MESRRTSLESQGLIGLTKSATRIEIAFEKIYSVLIGRRVLYPDISKGKLPCDKDAFLPDNPIQNP